MKLKNILKTINDFFFKPQPVHSVALLRILFGIIVLIQWFSIWQNLQLFWGPESLVSLETATQYSSAWRLNLFEFLPGDIRSAVLLAGLLFVGAFGMILGIFTKFSIFLVLITLMSFHNRNIFILNSGDMVIRNFLFLLMLAPCGEVYSLGQWLNRKRRFGIDPQGVQKSPWALRLMQLQFCVIYLSTAMFKMKGSMWVDGTAVYTATRLDDFLRVTLPILNNLNYIKFLTWGALAIEFALGTFVWVKEFRYWILAAGVLLHLGIEVSMYIPLFEWVMIATMISMVDSRDIYGIQIWFQQFWRRIFSAGQPFLGIMKPQEKSLSK